MTSSRRKFVNPPPAWRVLNWRASFKISGNEIAERRTDMSIIDYFKDLKAIGSDLISETAESKKHLDTVKFELGYAQFVMDDIKKDIKEYQFQAQPRIDAINTLSTKIQNELSK
jgi:hypothetical protein